MLDRYVLIHKMLFCCMVYLGLSLIYTWSHSRFKSCMVAFRFGFGYRYGSISLVDWIMKHLYVINKAYLHVWSVGKSVAQSVCLVLVSSMISVQNDKRDLSMC